MAAPAGMKTPFWKSDPRDTSTYLEPEWVAREIISNFRIGDYRYSEILILREPPRVKLIEKR